MAGLVSGPAHENCNVKATYLAWQAARQRRLGHYDRKMLAAAAAAWRLAPSTERLLSYALLRRDMGLPLPSRWVEPLRAGLGRLRSTRRRLALGLLAEHGVHALDGLPKDWLQDASNYLPALAEYGTGTLQQLLLQRLHAKQTEWRQQFAAWLAECSLTGPIAIVGNAATLEGTGLGSAIEACSAVVRFNRCGAGADFAADVGSRTDVWVVSPAYRGPIPSGVRWILLTGPDMRYRLQDWSMVIPLLKADIPVLTFPLITWRQLVHKLQAPPSAGLLMLLWLSQLSPAGWSSLRVAGIGTGLNSTGRYHRTNQKQAAASRHAWIAERSMLSKWRLQGLVFQDSFGGK